MLSLKSGTPIATINYNSKDKKHEYVYLKSKVEDEEKSELDTTDDNKIKIFKKYLKLDPKLSQKEINYMMDEFRKGVPVIDNEKLDRKYENAREHVEESLKYFLQYPISTNLFPLNPDEDRFTLYISGQGGSGKTWFARNYIKMNRKKGQDVLIFSPFENDVSLKGIKNLIYIDLEEIEDQLNREYTIDDIPENSIIVFDDINSMENKSTVKKLESLRDKCLQIGRHKEYNLSVITINHASLNGKESKTAIRESKAFVCFPKQNQRDTSSLLKTYAGYTDKMIKEVLEENSRWIYVCKKVPIYWVSEHSVRLY